MQQNQGLEFEDQSSTPGTAADGFSQAGGSQAFSNNFGVTDGGYQFKSKGKLKWIFLSLLLLIGLGIGGYYFVKHRQDPTYNFQNLIADGKLYLNKIQNWAHDLFSSKKVEQEIAKPEPTPEPVKNVAPIIPENPYWILPSRITGEIKPPSRPWNSLEENDLRTMFSSEFNYQHFKAMQEIREKRLKGSDALLMDALNEKKLWLRMTALIGLSEMGYDVPLFWLEKALGNDAKNKKLKARVANYFARFEDSATAGEKQILRIAVRITHGAARLNILKALANNSDELTPLYLSAASYDPYPKIKKWLQNEVELRPVSNEIRSFYFNLVQTDIQLSNTVPKNYETLTPEQIANLTGVEEENNNSPTQEASPLKSDAASNISFYDVSQDLIGN